MGTTPYERALQQDEIQEVWKQIQERWDIHGDGWYPLTGSNMPPSESLGSATSAKNGKMFLNMGLMALYPETFFILIVLCSL
jgi:hypothetical protein